MPRKARELVDSGIYHVYSRGNNRQKLFRSGDDYAKYRLLLSEGGSKYRAEIFHYCLMTNHVHLLMRIKDQHDLGKIMHRTQLCYTKYYKKQYRYIGHLYQGRFRSPRIKEESYYLQCGRYIERNPVNAGMVIKAEEYPYSSAG